MSASDGASPMSATPNLSYLLARCKASVTITANSHRDVYQTAREWIDEQRERADGDLDLAPEIEAEMVARNTIVEIQAYPDTPIGFFVVLHYDLDAAVLEMADTIRESDRDVETGKVIRVKSFDELRAVLGEARS